MQRAAIDLAQVHPTVQNDYQKFHADTIAQVAGAVGKDPVVVIGMKTNPFVKRAKKALDGAGVGYTYLEFGGYTSEWKKRLAIKMWSGWPTFPQVFINGKLVGGAVNVEKLVQENKLQQMLQEGR